MYKHKKKTPKEPISVLILGTLPDYGMKSLGNKSLIQIKNQQSLIDYQLNIIKKSLRGRVYEILYICSYDCNRIQRNLQKYQKAYNLRIIHQEIDNINYGGSLLKGISHAKHDTVWYMDYGLLFRDTQKIVTDNNCIFITNRHKSNSNLQIGCHQDEEKSTHLFFGIGEHKYLESGILTKESTDYIKKIDAGRHINKFSFEIINLLSNRFQFNASHVDHKNVLYIDSAKLIAKSKRFLNANTKIKYQ